MSTSYSVVFLAVVIGIIPITWWVWFLFKGKYLKKNNPNLLVEIFFWGVFGAIIASIIEIVIADTGSGSQIVLWMQKIWLFGEVPFKFTVFLSAGLIATIEELAKLIAIIIVLGRRKLKNVNDGLIFGLIVGLAFAVIENGVYFSTAVQSREIVDFGSVVILRFILSTSAHVIYSGVAGLFFAKAKLEKGSKKAKFFLLATCFPILMHTTFNFLLGASILLSSLILATIISVGMLMLWSEYQENHGKRLVRNKK